MISWIIATHDRGVLRDNLLASLGDVADDELIVVEGAPSIAVAYNEGARRAKRSLRCYIHHDVQILNVPRLRGELAAACGADVGIVGVVGSRTAWVPWWEGQPCGSVRDARLGRLDFGPGGPCAYLDGMLLATAQLLHWDETYPGWHLYDHDICEQMLRRGLSNVCLDDGAEVLLHNTSSPTDVAKLRDWPAGRGRFMEKWR